MKKERIASGGEFLEELPPLALVKAIDESMLSMVLLFRYEKESIEERLHTYETLHAMRKVLLSQIPDQDGH